MTSARDFDAEEWLRQHGSGGQSYDAILSESAGEEPAAPIPREYAAGSAADRSTMLATIFGDHDTATAARARSEHVATPEQVDLTNRFASEYNPAAQARRAEADRHSAASGVSDYIDPSAPQDATAPSQVDEAALDSLMLQAASDDAEPNQVQHDASAMAEAEQMADPDADADPGSAETPPEELAEAAAPVSAEPAPEPAPVLDPDGQPLQETPGKPLVNPMDRMMEERSAMDRRITEEAARMRQMQDMRYGLRDLSTILSGGRRSRIDPEEGTTGRYEDLLAERDRLRAAGNERMALADRERAMGLQSADAQRQAAMRDPASQESRRAQALAAQVFPEIAPEALAGVPASELEAMGLLQMGNVERGRRAQLQAQMDAVRTAQGARDARSAATNAANIRRAEIAAQARRDTSRYAPGRAGGGGGRDVSDFRRNLVQARFEAGETQEEAQSAVDAMSDRQVAAAAAASTTAANRARMTANNPEAIAGRQFSAERQLQLNEREGSLRGLDQASSGASPSDWDAAAQLLRGGGGGGGVTINSIMANGQRINASPQAMMLAQQALFVSNAALRLQSGAAVTDPEWGRFQGALTGPGFTGTGQALRAGLEHYRDLTRRDRVAVNSLGGRAARMGAGAPHGGGGTHRVTINGVEYEYGINPATGRPGRRRVGP